VRWSTPRIHAIGEKRTVPRFAWAPTDASDGHTYWLARVLVTEEWRDPPGFIASSLYGTPTKYGRWVTQRIDPMPRRVTVILDGGR
jgi:hypothetical protein